LSANSDHKLERNTAQARQGRTVALVIAGTMVLWMLSQWIGQKVGISTRVAFLFDLAALAGFIWAFIVTYQLWRARRESQE